jgi:hypothetical protein
MTSPLTGGVFCFPANSKTSAPGLGRGDTKRDEEGGE